MNQELQGEEKTFRLSLKTAIGISYTLTIFVFVSTFFSSMSLWSDGAGNSNLSHFWSSITGIIIAVIVSLILVGWNNCITGFNNRQKILYIILCIPICIMLVSFLPSLGFMSCDKPLALVASIILHKKYRTKSTSLLLISSLIMLLYPFFIYFYPLFKGPKTAKIIMAFSLIPIIQWSTVLWFSISVNIKSKFTNLDEA